MAIFEGLPIWLNGLAFLLSAGAVWIAGTKLSYFVDVISRKTGVGQAVVGVILLGGITSLPEIAVAGSASIGGDAPLAVNNLLGGFAMQVVVLAVADIAIRKHALTFAVPDPIVLLQGVLGMLMVSLVCIGIATGDIAFLGAGAWTWGVLLFFLFSIRLVAYSEGNPTWKVVGQPPAPEVGQAEPEVEHSLRHAIVATAIAALVILVAGFVLSESGGALAEQTGLGSSFFGAVFVAISTSLPEVSTVLAAIRLKRYVMAVSDIFGTNLFDIVIIFLVDLFYLQGPVLNEVGTFSVVAGLLGIVVTGLYVVGLVERRDPTIFGVGVDSIAVVASYFGGIGLLFMLR